MNSFSEMFKASIRTFLWERERIVAAEIIAFNEETVRHGYCDTCHYDETSVQIDYYHLDGEFGVYRYFGGFSDLVNELVSIDA